ncbi:MAG: ribosome maturation factor RimP [Vampirovibrionia bacterium]
MNINKSDILEKLEHTIEDSAYKLGLTVIDTTFNKEHGKYFLRIFIYHPERPINHGDCSDLTKLLSTTLDETDLIDVPFSLEISSPGINRKLKNSIEYDLFKGKNVKITLKKPLEGEDKKNTYTGTLQGLSDDAESVLIEINGENKNIEFDKIKTVQLEG